jgi:hypothetical protein
VRPRQRGTQAPRPQQMHQGQTMQGSRVAGQDPQLQVRVLLQCVLALL